ncbi:RNA polymerase sigma factor [Tenacibaculum finnmarkense genomovar finnmarkense]|uniref:RNA polymerase sigma factor n=1 Tax=Tenacibaculum finnmarkense TaxID=2781243 RepID=UPI000C65E0CC|nr:RNA polymerase sigma factor [Tenacibaculum finnmarkense]MBE7647499.1 sigma-70 family RNA polymerase sigma factor [Tenacibaculum finnmarkense genomovar ulcerans]MBE7661272.1 sigma-70 family RNA polymerase sigma factor [Tenacibaculum finnmarkense genomovar finnmarkense]MBE7692337.1 sigma-70 family RNA polymerase sigma factor [Tenacibaculum finnmarkense genomovar finnmarkense]MCD8413362.1 RNA polymerase sigma factor [Tenacibaculum finnmarkense genomovar ulcerans]MCD8418461.1 RNA polymerase sig
MTTDELTLIKKLQNPTTKDAAFKQLLSLYKERLYWHIRKIVISHADADDVLQNTFIKIFKNIGAFKKESKLYSWMYRIATNESISFINKRAKEKNVAISEYQQQLVSSLDSDHWFTPDQIAIVLQKAIATLPQKQQLVFNMKYFDEMKYAQISDILGTSIGALKASYHIAVKKIEKFIKNSH